VKEILNAPPNTLLAMNPYLHCRASYSFTYY